MDAEFNRNAEELFDRLIELPPGERAPILNETAHANPDLAAYVARLLAADEQAATGGKWDRSALQVAALTNHRDTPLERYRLLERIGAGGMAVVYKAVRDDDQYSKTVAVKLVLMPDPEAVERFRRERQLLAGLEHPNIVHLLDGGAAADGSPFLVMDYVDGLPIDHYVRRHNLSPRDIVRLFRKICSAVGYAHRNLIVHRDLKPANILVTSEGEPKVLDFGIAKVMDATALTKTGAAAMTPAFASPEQIRGAPVSTATDIYSLGVILYTLLTNSRPYRATESSIDLAKAICEAEPAKMTGIDTDLETVVQMALRKEPERRYATAEQFSEDLGRYLDGYPVAARPDTTMYRAVKFAGRNKAGLAAAAILILTLAGGIAATVREAAIANRRFSEIRSLAHYFVFDVHDGIKDLPGSTPMRRRIVEKGLEYLDKLSRDDSNDPDLQREIASAYEQIASAQGGLRTPTNDDNGAAALASYRKAGRIREALVRANPRNATDLLDLAELYNGMGSVQTQSIGDLKGGLETLRKGRAAAERAIAAAPSANEPKNVLADSLLMLGDATGNPSYQNLGDIKGAEEFYRKALELRENLVKAEPNKTRLMNLAMAHNRMGMILNSKGDQAAALPHLRRVQEIDEQALAADPNNAPLRINTASASRNLALVAYRAGQKADALTYAHRARELALQMANDTPKDLTARTRLADALYAEGHLMDDDARAMPLYDEALSIYHDFRKAQPGTVPPVTMRTLLVYRAEAALNLKKYGVAQESAAELIAIAGELLQKDAANVSARSDRLRGQTLLGEVFGARGDRSRATAAWSAALNDFKTLDAAGKTSVRDRREQKNALEALKKTKEL